MNDIESLDRQHEHLVAMLAFFRMVQGSPVAFRLRDWSDSVNINVSVPNADAFLATRRKP